MEVDKLMFPDLKEASDPEQELTRLKSLILDRTVADVGRHGKYFWIRLTKPQAEPTVMLMHFGMTGMIKIRDVESHLIFMENGGDKKVLKTKESELKIEDGVTGTVTEAITVKRTKERKKGKKKGEGEEEPPEWPPKFTKFELLLEKSEESESESVTRSLDVAFSDPRRLGRVRILSGPDCESHESLMRVAPLKALGPDYSKKIDGAELPDPFVSGDPDPWHHGRPRLLLEDFAKLVLSKKKPIKALLLDQDQFAGVGNWVSDEICYHACIHPNEIISAKISDTKHPVLEKLYNSIIYIMETSVSVEGNVSQFPEDWLMLHRWGKGRKEKAKTILGHTVTHETIGGRTSCFVPELQKPLKREAEYEPKKTTRKRPKKEGPKTEPTELEPPKTPKKEIPKMETPKMEPMSDEETSPKVDTSPDKVKSTPHKVKATPKRKAKGSPQRVETPQRKARLNRARVNYDEQSD